MKNYLEKPLAKLSLQKINLKNKNWVVQHAVAVPYLSWFAEIAFIEGLDQIGFGSKIMVTSFKNGQTEWRFDKNKMVADAERLISDELNNKNVLLKIYYEWREDEKNFLKTWNRNLSEFKHLNCLSNEELWLNFLEFSNSYLAEYIPPLLTESASAYGDVLIENLARKDPGFALLASDLATSEVKPFVQKEKEELLRIALKYPKVEREEVEKHQQKWFWLHNNYKDTEPLKFNYFEKRIREIIKKGSAKKFLNKQRHDLLRIKDIKKKIVAQKLFDDQTLAALKFISFCTGWQDKRKQYNMMANYILNEYLKEFGKRLRIDFRVLQYALPWEIKEMLFKKKNYRSILEKRINGFARITTPGKESFVDGREYLTLRRIFADKLTRSIKEFKGIIGSKGVAKGRVKIVLDPNKAEVFKRGDILVAGMARPDYGPLMRKAAAIVTNEGGITCHAAVVARELGIPCIIGTKIATKALKDGDIIEVDANKGIVRKM